MTAKEALFAEMGWAEDAKDAPGQMPLPGFENTIKNWGQKSKGRKKGIGAAAIGGGVGASSPAGSPQEELEAHDKKNHPDGYKGGRCKLRADFAAKGFDVRGYDAKVHNFTAPEGYDYNVDDRKGDGEKESGEGKAAIGEQVGEEQKSEEGEKTLPEPEKVDIGGTEITAMTEDGKKIADLLARLDKEPEKVIAEHEEFAGLNPDEVKEKLQEALKKLSENPATNADAKTQAQQQAAQQEQNQAQQAQHEQAIAAGNELNAEVSSEAGQLDLLTKNHEQAVADIAQQIKALNGKEPETTALKNELVKENKKFEKEFQKIDPVAQDEDGTPESPDDHAKHCKANPKSNCPFLKGAMTPEQLQQLDAQSAQEAQQAGAEGGQVVPAEGKVVPQGEGQNSQEGAGEGNAQGEQGDGEGDFSHLKGAVTDEQYEQVKKSPQWEQFRKMLVDYLSKGGDVDVSDTTKFAPNGIFMRTFNEVIAGLKFQGRKVEEWSENDVVDVPAEGSSDNPEAQKNQEQIGNQEKQTDKKSDFQNLGENPLGEEQGGEGDADDLDFDDDGDVEPEQPPPTDGTPSPEQGAGQEPPDGQQPFVDNGRRPGLMHKRDWTPAQRTALQELAKRFGAAAEGFRKGVSDEKFNQLLNNISNFTDVKSKWATTPNVSEHRQGVRDTITGMMDKHVDKSYTDIMYDEMETLRQSDQIPTRCKAALADLQQRLRDPYNTSADKQRIYNQYDALARKYGLDDILKNGEKSEDIVKGYREDGDANHRKGLPTVSDEADKNYKVDISGIPDVETHNGSLTNGDAIAQKMAHDIKEQTRINIDPSEIKVTPLMAMTEFTFEVPEGTTLSKSQGEKILEAIKARFPLKEIQKGNERAPQKAAYTFDPNTQTFKVSVENETKGAFSQKKLLESKEFKDAVAKGGAPVILGVDAQQRPIIRDLTEIVHALMVGASGAGKSVMINDIITSLLSQSPYNIRLGLVDLAGVELPKYDGSKQMVMPTATTAEAADKLFNWYSNEMDARRELFQKAKVKDLAQYNRLGQEGKLPADLPKHLPYLPLIVDEFSDLMDSDLKSSIVEKLNKMSREARKFGVHMFFATQKGTTDFVPSSVSSQATTRIGLAQTDSVNAKKFGTPEAANIPTRSGGFQMKIGNALVNGTSGILPDEGYDEIANRFSAASTSSSQSAAPAGETAAPTQSPDQIIDGLAKTPKGKAGLKAIADRLTQGNMKPITVGEKVADMTKKLLDGMGFGYTEMKGADGKVTITPKPKAEPTAETNEATPETTSEVKEEKSASETKADENKADTSSTEEVKNEEYNQNPEREAERNSIDESLRGRYDAYHRDFDKAIDKAFEIIDKKTASGKEITGADYDQADNQVDAAIAIVNQFREKNGLPLVEKLDKDRKPVFEKKEASVAEAQGAEPAKEGAESPEQPEDQWDSYESQYEQTREGQMKRLNEERDAARKQLANELIKKGVDPKLIRNDRRWKAQERDFANEEARINEQYPESAAEEPQEVDETQEKEVVAEKPTAEASKYNTSHLSDEEKFEFETEQAHHDSAIKSIKDKYVAGEIDRKEYRKQIAAANKSFESLKKEFKIGEAPQDEAAKASVSENPIEGSNAAQGGTGTGETAVPEAQGENVEQAAEQEPVKEEEPAPAAPQKKKNPENPDGTKPPANDNPPDGGDDDNSPPDDGGAGGGGSGGGGAGGSTGGATKEPAPAAEPEKPVAKVEPPAEEPKAPTDEEVDAQVNSDANIKALEKQVQSAKTTKDKRAAQSRLNQAKKSLGAAIRTAATQESGVRDVRTKKPAPQKPAKTTTATTKEKVPAKPEPKPVASKESEKKQAAANKPEKKAAPSTTSTQAKEPPKATKEKTSGALRVNKPEKKPAQKPIQKPEAKQETPKKEAAAKPASTTAASTTTGKEPPKTSMEQKAEAKAPAKSRADNIKTAAEIYARNMNLPNAAQHPMNVNMANELVTAIEKKDPKVLLSKLGQGNEMSREAFEKITGTKLPYSPKELKKVIENYCGSEIGSEKPAQKPQAQGAKPAESPKKETPAQAPAAKKTEEGEKKSDNNGMTPEYADYLKRKEAREKAEAEKQAKIKAEREERLRQAQMGRRDNSRGLNNQSQQFEVEAMKKTDPTKSENFKAISELKPPEKIDNESANALNEQFDKVADEIAKLESELKRNEEEGTLKPSEIQERVGMIGHLRKALFDVTDKHQLGTGNFTYKRIVDDSGHIKRLEIISFKGNDGKMSAVNPIEKEAATTTATSQKSASQKQGTDTKKEEKSTSANPAPKATQQEISFGDEGDKRSKEQQSIRDRVEAIRKKLNKKGATAKGQ